jgi:hypothetical protein
MVRLHRTTQWAGVHSNAALESSASPWRGRFGASAPFRPAGVAPPGEGAGRSTFGLVTTLVVDACDGGTIIGIDLISTAIP